MGPLTTRHTHVTWATTARRVPGSPTSTHARQESLTTTLTGSQSQTALPAHVSTLPGLDFNYFENCQAFWLAWLVEDLFFH